MIASSVMSSRRHLAGEPALADHQHAVAEADQLGQFRRDDDDADALVGEVAQDAVDLRLGADVDAARRLVHQAARAGRRPAAWRCATFCWLPPDRLPTPAVDAGAAAARAARAARFGQRCLAAACDQTPAASHALQVQRRDVLRDRQVEEDAGTLAVFAAGRRCRARIAAR